MRTGNDELFDGIIETVSSSRLRASHLSWHSRVCRKMYLDVSNLIV